MTLASAMTFLGWSFVILKLAATVIQVKLLRGNYRQLPSTALFRVIYIAGKATPSLAAASFSMAYAARHDWLNAWIFGLLAVGIAVFATFIVRMRKQGRFFGMLDWASRRKRP